MQLKSELKMRLGIATAMANALAFPISWTNKQEGVRGGRKREAEGEGESGKERVS